MATRHRGRSVIPVTVHDEQWPARLEFMIPHYGSETYLRAAVTSVLRQTDPRWSLTVVEDGAPHDSVVREWVAGLGDPRVSYVANDRTLGVAGNFQRCLDLATDEFVTFLGFDDVLRPRYVDVVRTAIRSHPDVVMVQPGVEVIDATGERVRSRVDTTKAWLRPRHRGETVLGGEGLLTRLLHGNWTYFPSISWHRPTLSAIGFRQDLDVALDLVALATLVANEGRMLLVDDVVFDYRRHSSSASSAAAIRTDRFAEEARVAREMAAMAERLGWRRAARAARTRISSRAHAAALVPQAIGATNWTSVRSLLRHAFGP